MTFYLLLILVSSTLTFRKIYLGDSKPVKDILTVVGRPRFRGIMVGMSCGGSGVSSGPAPVFG